MNKGTLVQAGKTRPETKGNAPLQDLVINPIPPNLLGLHQPKPWVFKI